MTSHCITWHDTTQAITSHQMTWPSHHLTPQQTSRHQNTSLQSTKHHHHGTAEGSFTAKKWFGHRAGRSPCAHSIGKFFLCYIVLFLLETSAPGLSGHYWYRRYDSSKKRAPPQIPGTQTLTDPVLLWIKKSTSQVLVAHAKGDPRTCPLAALPWPACQGIRKFMCHLAYLDASFRRWQKL